jgi:hypothetical protein
MNMSAERNQKQKVGRPAILEGGSEVVTVRLSREQYRIVLKACRKAKKQKSEWARSALFEAALQAA